MVLHVHLYDRLIGVIHEPKASYARLTLEVVPEGEHGFGFASRVMSDSIPLITGKRSGTEITNFFDNLLPEGAGREHIANRLRVGNEDLYPLLRHGGGDVAGALSIVDPDESGRSLPNTLPLNDVLIGNMLRGIVPSAFSNLETRASLGGVQRKVTLALAKNGGTWGLAEHSYPSTHIFKSVVAEHPSMIYNEAFGLQLAHDSGLIDYGSQIQNFNGADALVIERFDRKTGESGKTSRIHQEDMCQMLGEKRTQKYQRIGGRNTGMSLRRIAEVLNDSGERSNLHGLLRATVFHMAIGNTDAHAKNMAVIRDENGNVTMAPAYDIVPLAHTGRMSDLALDINGVKNIEELSRADLKSEARVWGLKFGEAENIIDEVLFRINESIGKIELHQQADQNVVEWIAANTKKLYENGSNLVLPIPKVTANPNHAARCSFIVKSTSKPCILKQGHGGNHKSVLRASDA